MRTKRLGQPWPKSNVNTFELRLRTFYNQSAAAELLDIDRVSLARKIDRYGISIPAPCRGRPRKVQP